MSRLSDWIASNVHALRPRVERYTIRITCSTPPRDNTIERVVENAFDESDTALYRRRDVWLRVNANVRETRTRLHAQLRPYLTTALSDLPVDGTVGLHSVEATYDDYFDVPYDQNQRFSAVADETFEYLRQFSNFDSLDMDTMRRKVVEKACGDPDDVVAYDDVDGVDTTGNIYTFQEPSWKPGLRGHHSVYLPTSLRRRLKEATGDDFERTVHEHAVRTTITADVILPADSQPHAVALAEQFAADLEATTFVSTVHDTTVVDSNGSEHQTPTQEEDARDQLALVSEHA